MRFALRCTLVLVVLIVVFLLLKNKLSDLWDQYSVPAYISALGNSYRHGTVTPYTSPLGEAADKVIVMAKMAHEDTSWVNKHLPE